MEVNHDEHRAHIGVGPLQHLSVDVLLIAIAVGLVISTGISPTTRSTAPTSSTPLIKLRLNEASVGELGLLPAVGPRLADRIIQYRAAHDRFRNWADLESVSGMGPATIDTVRPWCVIEPSPDTLAQLDVP